MEIVSYIFYINKNWNNNNNNKRNVSVMVGKCSPDIQNWGSNRHPANVGSSFFRDTNDDQETPTQNMDLWK